jgi:hypothetical protein
MIGQTGAETTTLDPQNNVLMRMVEWVENGNAPETVTGTKYVNVTLLVSELLWALADSNRIILPKGSPL